MCRDFDYDEVMDHLKQGADVTARDSDQCWAFTENNRHEGEMLGPIHHCGESTYEEQYAFQLMTDKEYEDYKKVHMPVMTYNGVLHSNPRSWTLVIMAMLTRLYATLYETVK